MSDTYDPNAVAQALNRQAATNTLSQVSTVPPAAAASAISTEKVTGLPATTGMFDPATAASALKKQQDDAALGNPAVSKWVANAHPAHVAAAQDGLPSLATIAQQADAMYNAPWRQIWDQAKTQASQSPPQSFGDFLKQFTQNLFGSVGIAGQVANVGLQGPAAISNQQAADAWLAKTPIPKILEAPWQQKGTSILDLIQHTALQALGGLGAVGEEGALVTAGAAHEPGINPLPGEFRTPLEAARFAAKTPADEGSRWEIQRTDTGYKAAQVPTEPSIGVPPAGVSPEADRFTAARAELDAEAVKATEEAVAASPIATSSPDTMRDFLDKTPGIAGQSAYIDANKLMTLASDGKISPETFDKLTGQFGSDTHDAFMNAYGTGGEFGLPLSDYLAHVSGTPEADALREITRFSGDGVSQADAKDLWEAEPEQVPPEHTYAPPPIAHDPELSDQENAALKLQEPTLQAAAKQAAQTIYLKGVFADAKALGMSEPDLAAWSGKVQGAQQAIYEKLVARAKKQIKQFQTPKWKATYSKHYSEVSNDFLGRPAVVARNQLTSSATENTDLLKDNGLVANGKPITFYRTTPYHDTGDGEVPMDLFNNPRPVQSPHPYWKATVDLSTYRGASFAEDPKFVEGWGAGAAYKHEIRGPNGEILQHEKRPISWITHIKSKSFGDFRRPEDVEKALAWYKEKNPQEKYESDSEYAERIRERKQRLQQGSWPVWESPEMLKDLGWDAVRMNENAGQPVPNIFVTNPAAIHWKYDLGSVPTKIRLDLADRALLPKELLDRLPKGIWDKDGEPVDSYAEQLGFSSGEQMLQEIASMEDLRGNTGFADWLERQIKQESAERAKDELGWDLSPASVLETAKEMVDAPEVEDLLVASLKALREEMIRMGIPPASIQFDRAQLAIHAKDLFEQMPSKDAIDIQRFERAIRDNSRKVETGLVRGNAEKMIEAFKNRQQQLLNYLMLREAHSFKRLFEATNRNWQRLARRSTSPTIDQDFLNQIHVILRNAGFRVNRQDAELADSLHGVTLSNFMESLREAMMQPPQSDMPTKPTSEMSVADFRDLREMVNGLKRIGAAVHLAYAGEASAKLNEIGETVASNADAVGRRYPLDKIRKDRGDFFKTMVARAGKVPRVIGSLNIRPETYLFYLDKDEYGPLMKYVVNTLAGARYMEDDLHKSIMKDLEAFYKTQPKGWLGSMNKQIAVPELQHRGIAWIRTRGDAVVAALNLGTMENATKFAAGFGWSVPEIESALGRVLRPEDWAYVQKIWAIHEETLWPKIVETYRDKTVSGVPPRRKAARMVQTPNGPIQGGYFGIHYDQAELERLGLRDPTLRNPSNILGGEYRSAAPSNNFSKAVTGFTAPMALDFDFIPSRITQIIHDVSWRRALIQANKVLNHPQVVAAVQEALGPEFPRLNRQWLEYIAREAVYSGSGGDSAARAIRAIRSNFMATQILFRVSTMALHTPTAAIHMIGEGGNIGKAAADIYGQALADMLRSEGQLSYWMNFIDEKSGEIRNIEYGIDRDVRDAIIKAEKGHGPLSAVKMAGFSIFAYSKKVEARITWLARYRQVMDSTNDEEQAIALANKSVRDTQGAGSVMDLPPLLRGGHDAMGELGKTSATLFMGFRNTFANRQWRIAVGIRRVLEGEGRPDDWNIVKWILTFVVLSAAWYKFEQENYGGRATSYVEALAHQTLGSLPLGDLAIDTATAGLRGQRPEEGERHSPETEILGAFEDDFLAAMGKPVKAPIRSAVDTIGYLGGVAPDQFGIALQHAWDVSQGNASGANPLDYVRGTPSSGGHRGLRRSIR